MRPKISHPSMVSEPSLSLKYIPRMGLDSRRHNETSHHSINSPSILNSYDRKNNISENENISKADDIDSLPIEYFMGKYMFGEEGEDKLVEEMEMIVNRKRNEVESLRIYRDELRFISKSNSYNEPLKISLQILKEKASIEEKLSEYKEALSAELKTTEKNIHCLEDYEKYMLNVLEDPFTKNNDILDIEKEEEVMIRNLENETEMFLKELIEEQKRNSREVKQIQEEILDYRVSIKEKEDNLRNLKAKICTLYIKLHSRNNSRSGSKSKNRNLSLSVKKFNYENHSSVKEVFVGNSTFKSYSREIIEKVTAEDDLVKIRFIVCSSQNEILSSKENGNNKGKENILFQCIYRKKEGQLHDNRAEVSSHDIDATRDKLSEASEKSEEIYTKYLLSMKFYYKSKIVGVECRVKTDKGNKHIQIGNCSSNLEHELLTLVNKKIITLASFWHGKDMIGISVWYSEKPKGVTNSRNEVRGQKEARSKEVYQEYYS